MKQSLNGQPIYSGASFSKIAYGVADRSLPPFAEFDNWAQSMGYPAPGRVSQVHGDRVVACAAADGQCEADAIAIGAGEAALIRVADCVPVILIDAEAKRAAAVHAGWRGTFAQIVPKALKGFDAPARIYAYIGPAIGPCCYEVSGELAAQFRDRFGGGPWLQIHGGKPHLDLPGLNAWQLERAGVGQIDVERQCTFDSPDLHSFRRDGSAAGRLAAFVMIAATPV